MPKKTTKKVNSRSGGGGVKTKKTGRAKASKKKMLKAVGKYCFWVNFGPILSDLYELENALDTITDKQFRYHVGGKRNDFACWVQDVLKEKPLAEKLAKCKTRGGAGKIVRVYIKNNYK